MFFYFVIIDVFNLICCVYFVQFDFNDIIRIVEIIICILQCIINEVQFSYMIVVFDYYLFDCGWCVELFLIYKVNCKFMLDVLQ